MSKTHTWFLKNEPPSKFLISAAYENRGLGRYEEFRSKDDNITWFGHCSLLEWHFERFESCQFSSQGKPDFLFFLSFFLRYFCLRPERMALSSDH